jgi:hypothetical protein
MIIIKKIYIIFHFIVKLIECIFFKIQIIVKKSITNHYKNIEFFLEIKIKLR